MKGFISFVLTTIITATCFLYTYSPCELPLRDRAFEVSSNDGSVSSLYEIVETYRDYKDTPLDVNTDFRRKETTISGEIRIAKINRDGNRLQVITDTWYTDFGVASMFQSNMNGGECYGRRIVVYFSADDLDLYSLPVGKKIKFKAKFNTVNEEFIICTDGEVIADA